ncbi:hypothetical protein AB0J72_36870 [Dactylosporangium sp. NPDC049742]|uniref:hypothetical protein n=1 Tax=Dactylosporangium sp. NPDC049742 TaxID=3154737 RepID=UPI003416B590
MLRGWLNARAVKRFERVQDEARMARRQLYDAGRFAAYAQALKDLEPGYHEPRVIGAGEQIAHTRIERCCALVRANRPAEAEAEAAQFVADGWNDWLQVRLRHCMQYAHRDEPSPFMSLHTERTGWIRLYDDWLPPGQVEHPTTELLRTGIRQGWLLAAEHDQLTAWVDGVGDRQLADVVRHIERWD